MICFLCRKKRKIKEVFYKNPTNPFLWLCYRCFKFYTYNSKPINISKLFSIDNRKDFTKKQFFLIIFIIWIFNIMIIFLMCLTNTPITCIGLLCE